MQRNESAPNKPPARGKRMTKQQKEEAEKKEKEKKDHENKLLLTDEPEKYDPEKQTGYLNWFDLETRTKKLVYELLQPSLTRQAEERDLLD